MEVLQFCTMSAQEFGKAKIYMLPQDKLATLSKEVCFVKSMSFFG